LIGELLEVALLAFAPVSEIRGALPYGVLFRGLPYPLVLAVSFFCNLLPYFLVMFLLSWLLEYFSRFAWFRSFWDNFIQRTQKRFEPYKKWGKWGILAFVGIPLPFTGIWTGSVVCFLLGLSFQESFPYILGGLVSASLIMSLVVFIGS